MEMIEQELVKKTPYFDVWQEKWEYEANLKGDKDTMDVKVVRNKAGEFAGFDEVVGFLEKHGIAPELADDKADICTIGWSEREEKYYGWSHRAWSGFTIGDKIYEEDFDDDVPFTRHGRYPIKSKADARKAAINFARDVS